MTTQEVLQDCTVEGLVVKLPDVQLERKDYLEVKKSLELIGGKWKGGKTQGFVFEQDPSELLAQVANGEQRNLKKEYQYFATPFEVAEEMIERLPRCENGMRVLEPSAGDGALIKKMRAYWSGANELIVDCFEAMDLNRAKLLSVEGANIIGIDFLECYNRVDYYDCIIANPPFTKNQDVIHICKMYQCLKPGGIIVTLSSQSWMNGSHKIQKDFHLWLTELGAEITDIEPGRFKESGTMVGALMITIVKPKNKVVDIPETIEKRLSVSVSESEVFKNPCTPDNFQQQADAFVENLNMLSLKNNDMNFFSQLAAQGNVDITMRIMQKNNELTMMVMPGSANSTTKPINITGTPEDLDNEFFSSVFPGVKEVAGIITNLEQVKKEAEAAKDKKSSSAKPVKKEEKKPDPKPAKKEKPQPKAVDLFDAPVSETEENGTGDTASDTKTAESGTNEPESVTENPETNDAGTEESAEDAS